MKKVFILLLTAVLSIQMTGITSQAAELHEADAAELFIEQFISTQDYQFVDCETEIITGEELENYIKVSGDEDNQIEKSAVLKTYSIEADGELESIYVLTATATDKYSIGNNGDLVATICWRDNSGPNNELLYVNGTYAYGLQSDVYQYTYRKVGWYSSSVSGTWSGVSFTKYETNYTGLQFTLILTAGSLNIQVYTFLTD